MKCQNLFPGDSLHVMSKPVFWENKKNISKCFLLKFLPKVPCVYVFQSAYSISADCRVLRVIGLWTFTFSNQKLLIFSKHILWVLIRSALLRRF